MGQATTSLKSVFKFTENEIHGLSENQTIGPSFAKLNSYENLVRDKVRTGKHLASEQVSTGKILWLRRQIILTDYNSRHCREELSRVTRMVNGQLHDPLDTAV